MRKASLIGLFLAAASFLGACETIKGAGRDITRAGEAIEDAVDGKDRK